MDFANFSNGVDYDNFSFTYTNSTLYDLVGTYSLSTLGMIMLYAKPVFVVIGLITNLTAFIILCRKPFNSTKSSVFLCAFALSIMASILVYLVMWIKTDLHITIHFNEATCSLWIYCIGFVMALPNWLVGAAACERIITLLSGKKSKCGLAAAMVTVIVILATIGAINAHAFWTTVTTASYDNGHTIFCYVKAEWVDTIFFLHVLAVLLPEGFLLYLGLFLFLLSITKLRERGFFSEESIEKELTQIVLLAVVLHLISILPYEIVSMIINNDGDGMIVTAYYITYLIQMCLRSFLLFASLLSSKIFRQSLARPCGR